MRIVQHSQFAPVRSCKTASLSVLTAFPPQALWIHDRGGSSEIRRGSFLQVSALGSSRILPSDEDGWCQHCSKEPDETTQLIKSFRNKALVPEAHCSLQLGKFTGGFKFRRTSSQTTESPTFGLMLAGTNWKIPSTEEPHRQKNSSDKYRINDRSVNHNLAFYPYCWCFYTPGSPDLTCPTCPHIS